MKHPAIWAAAGSVTTALIAGLFGLLPSLFDRSQSNQNAIIDATVKKIELQQELKALRSQELDSVTPTFQTWVDHLDFYKSPAWAKVKSLDSDAWLFLAVNRSYVDFYGTPHNVDGKTGEQVYAERELSEAQSLCLAEYEVNDYRAVNLRLGTCQEFRECSLPTSKPNVIEYETFVKCPIAIGTRIAVIGHKKITE